MDPILIDECLSPYLAGIAEERGYVAMHVAWLNREGSDDRALAILAAERDYIIVRAIAATSYGSMLKWRCTTG
jgi:predicted nuclease of predicted toxin-antitoxin system